MCLLEHPRDRGIGLVLYVYNCLGIYIHNSLIQLMLGGLKTTAKL